jgi:hypothetical protein
MICYNINRSSGNGLFSGRSTNQIRHAATCPKLSQMPSALVPRFEPYQLNPRAAASAQVVSRIGERREPVRGRSTDRFNDDKGESQCNGGAHDIARRVGWHVQVTVRT